MDTLLILLGFVGGIGSLVFLVINIFRKKPKRTPLVALGVCFVLFVVGVALPSTKPGQNDTLEVKLDKIITNEIGKKDRSINLIEDAANGGNIATIKINGEDTYSLKMLNDSKKAFEKAFEIEDVSEVQLWWNGNLVDNMGKVHNETVLKIILKRNTADQIGWDLFDFNQFENIADSYWIHKALKN